MTTGNSPVIAYIEEEVRRQGHDTHLLDGIERVGWMLDAWAFAIEELRGKPVELHEVISLGKIIEPHKNKRGLRKVGVRVGLRVCPPPQEVRDRLTRWLEMLPNMQPLEAYREFELIHPFVDGNGRTGKVLLNLLNDSLHDPVFPPSDFWGHSIQNP